MKRQSTKKFNPNDEESLFDDNDEDSYNSDDFVFGGKPNKASTIQKKPSLSIQRKASLRSFK